jgi:hypothetical protein
MVALAARRPPSGGLIVQSVAGGCSSHSADGVPAGPVEETRPAGGGAVAAGPAPRYGPNARLAVFTAVTEQAPEADSHWSQRLLADTVGISAAQVGRILKDLGLKPRRVRGWLNRPVDSEFAAKARAVCALPAAARGSGAALGRRRWCKPIALARYGRARRRTSS